MLLPFPKMGVRLGQDGACRERSKSATGSQQTGPGRAMLGGACVLPAGLAAPAPSASLARHPLALRTAAPAARCGAPPRCAFIGDRFLEGMPSYAAQGSNPGLAEPGQVT